MQKQAHRVAYELLIGPIAAGLELDHLCRTHACVNPAHLEPVTGQVNLLRGVGFPATNAAKTHCPQGHEYTAENTYWSKKGQRGCRACTAEKQRRLRLEPAYRAKRAAAERARRQAMKVRVS